MGGLEGLRPSKKHMLLAGRATLSPAQRESDYSGAASPLPNPHHLSRINDTRYAVPSSMEVLEGLRPSKNHPFLVVVASKAGNDHEKKSDRGETPRGHPAAPNPTTARVV